MTLYRVGPRGAQGAGLIIGEGLPPTDQEQLASYGLGSTWLNSATGLGYGPLAKVGIGGDVSFGTDVSLDLSALGGSTGQTQDQVLALILAAKAFQGNWEAGTYQSGSVVVNNDAVWLAIQETDTEANVDSGHWILIGGAGAGGGGDVDTDAVNALITTALDDFDLSTYALKPTLTAGAIVAPLPDLTGHIFGGHHYDYANNDTIQWNVTAQDGHTVWVVSGWPDQDSGYFGGLIPYDLDAHQWGEITPIPVPTGAPVYDPNAPLIWHGFRGGGTDPGQESEGFTSPGWFSQLGSLALPDDWASVQLPEMIPGQKCWIRVQVLWPPAVFQHWLDNGGGPATDYPVVASSDIADFLAAPATSTGWCYFVTDGVPTQGQIDAWVNTIKTDPQYADISAMLALAAFQMVGHDPTNSTGAGEPWGFEGGVGGRIGRKLYFGGGDSNLFDDSSGVIDKDGNSPWSADYGRKFMSYDLDSGDFIDLPDIPVGVDWVFFGIADDKLYVVGTDNLDEDDDLLQVFDPSQGEVGEWSEPQHLNDLNPGNGVFVLHLRGTGQPGTYLFPWTGDGGQPGGGHAGVDYNIGLQVGRRLYWADYGVYMDLDTYAFSDCCDSIQMDGESTVVLDPDGVRIHRLGGYGHRVLDTRDNTWAAGVFATDARLHAWDSTATMAGFGTDGKLQVLTTDGVLKEVRVALDVMADPTQFIRFRDSSGTVIRAIGFDATDGHFHDYSVALNGTHTDQGAIGVGGGSDDDDAAYIPVQDSPPDPNVSPLWVDTSDDDSLETVEPALMWLMVTPNSQVQRSVVPKKLFEDFGNALSFTTNVVAGPGDPFEIDLYVLGDWVLNTAPENKLTVVVHKVADENGAVIARADREQTQFWNESWVNGGNPWATPVWSGGVQQGTALVPGEEWDVLAWAEAGHYEVSFAMLHPIA